jgi:hypothetical protein
MNCTAWNSLVANALRNSPSAIPSTALPSAVADAIAPTLQRYLTEPLG